MNTSSIFKKAHALTKSVIQSGDSYQVTFSIALKMVYSDMTKSILIGCKPYCMSKNGKLYFEAVAELAEEGDTLVAVYKKYTSINKRDLIIIGDKLIEYKERRRRPLSRDLLKISTSFTSSEYKVTGVGTKYMNYDGVYVQRLYLEEK